MYLYWFDLKVMYDLQAELEDQSKAFSSLVTVSTFM